MQFQLPSRNGLCGNCLQISSSTERLCTTIVITVLSYKLSEFSAQTYFWGAAKLF